MFRRPRPTVARSRFKTRAGCRRTGNRLEVGGVTQFAEVMHSSGRSEVSSGGQDFAMGVVTDIIRLHSVWTDLFLGQVAKCVEPPKFKGTSIFFWLERKERVINSSDPRLSGLSRW